MRIIAYSFDADVHCIACAKQKFSNSLTAQILGGQKVFFDENEIVIAQADSEGNPIRPIFSTDENPSTHCGTCHQPLN